MRKILAILFAMLMLFSAVACDSEATESSYSDFIEESLEPDTGESEVSKRTTTRRKKTTTRRKKTTTKTKKTTTTAKPNTDTGVTGGKTNPPTTAKPTTTKKTTTTTKKPAATTTTGFKPNPNVPADKPVTINAAQLYNPMSSKYDSQAEKMRQTILNASDTLKAGSGGRTFYVAANGSNSNNGTTKNTPWKSAAKIVSYKGSFRSGDVILFRRGDVFRDVSFVLPNGVSIGAYGSGPKPCLYGSDKNYANPNLWSQTSPNIWRVKVPERNAPSGAYYSIEDIGNIVINHGKICTSPGKKRALNLLKKDYDFYFDSSSNYLYLYCSVFNPGYFDYVEICPNEHVIRLQGSNHTVENVCIKYTGAHGISAGKSSNIYIRGCEVGYIGGAMLNATVRYGNGVEMYGGTNICTIENNWIYQCYDAGYTHQGVAAHNNIAIKNNLMEFTPYNIEVWTQEGGTGSNGSMYNVAITGNILRFAGFGYSSGVGRTGGSTAYFSHISFYEFVTPCNKVNITNNIFDTSYRYLVSIAYPNDSQGRGPTISGNTWNQQPFKATGVDACIGLSKLTGKRIVYQCSTQSEMETSVKIFDKSPKAITLDK